MSAGLARPRLPAGGRLLAEPLLPPALALPVGVALAPLLPVLSPLLLLPLGLAATLAALAIRRPLLVVTGAALWLLVLGVMRSQGASLPAVDAIAVHNGQYVELQGVISEEPDVRERTALLRVRVEGLARGSATHPSWQPASGAVQVRVPLTESFAYGDRLDLRGKLETPPILPDLDYRAFLARQGVGSVISFAHVTRLGSGAGDPLHAALARLRLGIAANLEAALPQPEAALQRAVLIGTKSATFSVLTPDFIRTGMIHLIATSGFKVAVVGGWALGLAAPLLGRRRAAWVALATVAAYILLTGATPAGLRAGLMWGLALGALLTGRPAASLQALALAVAAMVAVQPAVLGDTGFQLSAAATAGILLFQPRLAPWLDRAPGWLAEPVGVTIAAQVATLPITMVGFHQVSLVAPLANLLCLPVLPAAMAAGVLVAATQALSPTLGHLAGLLAYGFLAYIIAVVRLLAQVPAAAVAAPVIGGLFAALYYLGCSALLPVFPLPRPADRRHAPGRLPLRLLLAAALTLAMGLLALLQRGPATLTEFTLLDVGRGDALLVRDSAGQTVLVDDGLSKGPLLAQLGTTLPFWQRSLSGVVLLGAEEAHAGATSDLATRFGLGQVLEPLPASTVSQAALSRQRQLPPDVRRVEPPGNTALRTAGGVTVDLWPLGNASAPHLAAFIRVGDVTLLDAAALSPADERALLATGAPLQAAVLLAPRAAAAGTLDPAFLAAVQPALILAGAPAPGSVAAAPPDQPLLRTDQVGPIQLLTDGHTIDVE